VNNRNAALGIVLAALVAAAVSVSAQGRPGMWHIEGGKGTKGKLVKFQMRPDPLAR